MNKSLRKLLDYIDLIEPKVKFKKNFEQEFNIIKLPDDKSPLKGLIDAILKKIDIEELSYKDIYAEITNLRRIFNYTDEEYRKIGEIFVSFPDLCPYLEAAHLSDRDRYNIITGLIKRNISLNYSYDNTVVIDGRKILNYQFQTITAREVLLKIHNGEIDDFLNKSAKECSELELKQRQEIKDNIDKFKTDIRELRSSNVSVYNHIIENESPTTSDIFIGVELLKNLGISEYVTDSIKKYLLIEYEKHLKDNDTEEIADICIYLRLLGKDDESIKIILNTIKNARQKKALKQDKKEEAKPQKKYLTDKEYKTIKKEIKMVYDAYNMKLLKEVSYDEMIHIASLMLQIGYDESEVQRFIMLAYQTMENKTQTLEDTLKRLEFYLEEDKLINLNSYYEEMKKSTGDDYQFWYGEYLRELSKLAYQTYNRYEYEIEQARQLKR